MNRAYRPLLLLALPAGLLFAVLAGRFAFLTDDAYISFRYAEHLLAGHGLVWNPGAAGAPVEGYSNLGWILLVAAAQRLGLEPELSSRALSLLSGLVLLVLLARQLHPTATDRAGGESDDGPRRLRWAAALGAVLFLAAAPPFTVWATGGLETMAFALALFGTHSALARGSALGGAAWAAAAVLLRADGLAWVGMVVAAGVLDPRTRRWRLRGIALGVAAAVAALQIAYRLETYGDWLPNTARAKVSWSELDGELRGEFLRRGLHYVIANLLAAPALLVALGLSLRGLRTALPTAAVVAGGFAYCVAVGGDFMTMGRFLVPVLPFLALGLARGLESGFRSPRAVHVVTAILVLLSLGATFDRSPFPRSLRDRFHFRWNSETPVSEVEMWEGMRGRTAQLVELGRALARHTGPDEVATYGPVGAVGYHSHHTIHDTYGLTSRELLEHSTLGEHLRSPGHDRHVQPDFLRQLPLTYLQAVVVDEDAPLPTLPPSASLRWERFPLSTADGFAPGRELRILRP